MICSNSRCRFLILFAAALSGIAIYYSVLHFPDIRQTKSPEQISEETSRHTAFIPFMANIGQKNAVVKYYSQIMGGTVYVTEQGEITYHLFGSLGGTDVASIVLTEKFVDGNANPVSGLGRTAAEVHYYKGNNRSKWTGDIPTFESVGFGDIFDGIEFRLKARLGNVEKLFFVQPEADPRDIKIRMEGQEHLEVNGAGELVVSTKSGPVVFTRPQAYQELDGERIDVPARYRIDGDDYGFEVGEYNSGCPLVIDPLISSTFIGGNGPDFSQNIALDAAGNVFIFGNTESTDFPTTQDSWNVTANGYEDTFICKYNSDLTELLASAYLGGSGSDKGTNIRISSSGSIYLIGGTYSADFPVSADAYDDSYNGNCDIFITRLSNDLDELEESTFVGGVGAEDQYFTDFDIDENGDLFLITLSSSPDFPATSSAYDNSLNGGSDFAIAKLNGDLTELLAGTFIGGLGNEELPALALDPEGNVFIQGTSRSRNYPTTDGAYNRNMNNDSIVVSKFSNDLTMLLASTAISPGASTFDIVADQEGNVFICGNTFPGWPTTDTGWDRTHNGVNEGVITKLAGDLSTLLATTFMSGEGAGFALPWRIFLDGHGHLYGTGHAGEHWLAEPGAYDETPNGLSDGFVVVFDTTLRQRLGATLIGGSQEDVVWNGVTSDNGYLYCVGNTNSSNFPIGDADSRNKGGGDNDVTIFKITQSLMAKGSDLKNLYVRSKPKSTTSGGDVTLVAKIKNLSAFISPPTTISFYLSNQMTIEKNAILIGTANVKALNPNMKAKIKHKVTIQKDVPPGEYYLISFVDHEDNQLDPKRENNIAATRKKILVN